MTTGSREGLWRPGQGSCVTPPASQRPGPGRGQALLGLQAPPSLTWKLRANQTLAAAALSWPLGGGAMLRPSTRGFTDTCKPPLEVPRPGRPLEDTGLPRPNLRIAQANPL